MSISPAGSSPTESSQQNDRILAEGGTSPADPYAPLKRFGNAQQLDATELRSLLDEYKDGNGFEQKIYHELLQMSQEGTPPFAMEDIKAVIDKHHPAAGSA